MSKETLEEAAENYANDCTLVSEAASYEAFIDGAKWQAERMFTKDDLEAAFHTDYRIWKNRFQDWEEVDFEEWFEQFKKK